MKFKLDENIGRRGLELLRAAGHDAVTVRDQNLQGASDQTVFEATVAEGRALVTLDRGFGQVLRFPPGKSAGVVILEIGASASHAALIARIREFLAVVESRRLEGKLWIVEPGRVRIHLRDVED